VFVTVTIPFFRGEQAAAQKVGFVMMEVGFIALPEGHALGIIMVSIR
jgi:hypothetical protein